MRVKWVLTRRKNFKMQGSCLNQSKIGRTLFLSAPKKVLNRLRINRVRIAEPSLELDFFVLDNF